MGILYGWATKEYLFEHMTFNQIVMYLNEGIRFKYPKPQPTGGSLVGGSYDVVKERRDKLLKQYGYIGEE